MARALKACPVPGCANLTSGGRCTDHQRQADQARGTATARGYTSRGHARFRRIVLARDPLCVLCLAEGRQPPAVATAADHWPLSRRELIAGGHNPDDPKQGRGLCKPHHDRETARHQPGGWHAGAPGG